MEETTTSPKVEETTQLNQTPINFPQAMEKVIEGKKVHKLEWEDRTYYGFLNGEFLSLHKSDGKNYKWIVNAGDLNGTDYIVL